MVETEIAAVSLVFRSDVRLFRWFRFGVNDFSLVGYDRQIRRLGSAFKYHFGPRGREFERSNVQKFKFPRFPRGGGGGGMLKFRVDRRII